jgi:elongation factor P
MVFAGDFRNNVTFEMDGQVFQIIEFQHVKPGKGAAFVRAKIRNVITGSTVERTFNPTDKFERAQISRRDMQYLYQDGDLFYSAQLLHRGRRLEILQGKRGLQGDVLQGTVHRH